MTEKLGDACDGFTLLELLVVIFLMGILSAIMSAGLVFGLRSWQHANSSLTNADELASVQSTIGHMIAAAHPEYLTRERLDTRLYFEGASDHISFLAPLPAAIGHDIMGRQSLRVVRGFENDSGRLVFAWTLDLPGVNGSDAVTHDLEVLTRVTGVTFRYWGQFDDEATEEWHSDWLGQQTLPKLVHVEISMTGLPVLIVDARILAQVPSDCMYDRVSLTCRRP